MSRAQRIAPVQQLFDEAEQQRARELVAARQSEAASQQKLAELERYHADYHESFKAQAADGLGSLQLRDYRVFLGRLAEAVRQQTLAVARAREETALREKAWQEAARKAKALDVVVDRWQADARRQADRLEQKDIDERALRARGGVPLTPDRGDG